jgi:ABC-type multidrug transport system fused ATPase/permease subunit
MSGQIDIENTYAPPAASSNGDNSSSCCCCFGNSSEKEQTKKQQAKDKENEDKKELDRGLCGTRWSTLLMMALWIFSVIISRINLGWTGIDCDNLSTDDDSVIHDCIVNSAIYRASSVIVFLFGVQAFFSPFFVNIFDGYWILKILFVIGATAGLLIPYGANFFNDSAYEYIARIGAFIFIIFLQTIVLDFAYYWKQSWIDRSTVSGRMTSATLHGSDVLNVMNSTWHCALLVVSLLYLIIFVISIAVLFTFFGGDGCAANNSILTITLVLMVIALVMQMFLTKNGSIIASGVLAAYGLCLLLPPPSRPLTPSSQLHMLPLLLCHSILIEHVTQPLVPTLSMGSDHKLSVSPSPFVPFSTSAP